PPATCSGRWSRTTSTPSSATSRAARPARRTSARWRQWAGSSPTPCPRSTRRTPCGRGSGARSSPRRPARAPSRCPHRPEPPAPPRDTAPPGPPPAPAARGPAPGSPPGGRGLRLLPVLAAAAAILVVVVLSLWNLNLRDENAVYRDRLAALERTTQLANDPTASLVALDDNPDAPPGARATVIASTREDRGVLLVQDLPPLQRGRVYELWGVPEGDFARAQKAVVFVPLRRTGTQTLQFEVPIQPGTVFAIPDEPGPDGSQKPTTQPLLTGTPVTA